MSEAKTRKTSAVVPPPLESITTLLTPQEVCTHLRISRRGLARLMKKNAINYIRILGGYRFRPAALQLFLAQRTVGGNGKRVGAA